MSTGILYEEYYSQFHKTEVDDLGKRFLFKHSFTKFPSTGLAAWCNNATDANNIAAGFDPYFKLLETAGANTLAFDATGLKFSTNTTSADDAIVCPTTVDSDSAFGTAGFLVPDNGGTIRIAWAIHTGASVASVKYFIGAMENIKSAIGGTAGDDQAFFYYSGSGNWKFEVVKANSATEYDLGVPVVASTTYTLEQVIHPNGLIDLYINGTHVYKTAVAMDTATNQYPVCAFETSTTAAKDLSLRGVLVEVEYAS